MRPRVLVNALKLHEGPERSPNGNFQHVLHLAAEMAMLPGIEVLILTDLDSHGPLAERIQEGRLIPTHLRIDSIRAADRAVVQAVRRLRPDIYHRPTGQLPFRDLHCATVVGIADLNFKHLPTPLLKRLYKELSYRWTMRKADRVICVSGYTRDDVAKRYRGVAGRLRVVPHGTNELPLADNSLAQLQAGPFFLVFGNQAHKNVELCLRAFAELNGAIPGLWLALVGRNEHVETALRPMVNRLGLDAAIEFVGAPTGAQLAGLYKRATGLLFPSRFEGFGLPILEAMGAGCPVVCSNVCSLPEVAGEAAIMLDPDDVAGMRAAILTLVRDTAHRAEFIAAGHKQAARFTWRRAADLTEAIYREILYPQN